MTATFFSLSNKRDAEDVAHELAAEEDVQVNPEQTVQDSKCNLKLFSEDCTYFKMQQQLFIFQNKMFAGPT